jgi:hypothetical protein
MAKSTRKVKTPRKGKSTRKQRTRNTRAKTAKEVTGHKRHMAFQRINALGVNQLRAELKSLGLPVSIPRGGNRKAVLAKRLREAVLRELGSPEKYRWTEADAEEEADKINAGEVPWTEADAEEEADKRNFSDELDQAAEQAEKDMRDPKKKAVWREIKSLYEHPNQTSLHDMESISKLSTAERERMRKYLSTKRKGKTEITKRRRKDREMEYIMGYMSKLSTAERKYHKEHMERTKKRRKNRGAALASLP